MTKPELRVGDSVRVTALWSEFWGMGGKVTQVTPCVMVLLAYEKNPIRVDADSLAVDDTVRL